MENKTDWDIVSKAGWSTSHDPHKEKINFALSEILARFEIPLGKYFARRIGCYYESEQREEIYAAFCMHLIEKRKKIFRKASPSGKLQSYLYAIAWSFANRYIAKQKQQENGHLFIENEASSKIIPPLEVEKQEEREYILMIFGLALKKLRQEDQAKYELLYCKYFMGDSAPHALNIAQKFGIFPENSNEKNENLRIENLIHQRLSRARKTFFHIVEQEIRFTLQSLDKNEKVDDTVVEKKLIFCKASLENIREYLDHDFYTKVFALQLDEEANISSLVRIPLKSYFLHCFQNTEIDPLHVFELYIQSQAYHKINSIHKTIEETYRFLYIEAWRFLKQYLLKNKKEEKEIFSTIQNSYVLMIMELSLLRLQRISIESHKLLVQKYFSQKKPSGYELAISCGLLSSTTRDEKKKSKALSVVYQRLKRAKKCFLKFMTEEIALLESVWEPFIDSRQQALKLCIHHLKEGTFAMENNEK